MSSGVKVDGWVIGWSGGMRTCNDGGWKAHCDGGGLDRLMVRVEGRTGPRILQPSIPWYAAPKETTHLHHGGYLDLRTLFIHAFQRGTHKKFNRSVLNLMHM